MVLANDAQWTWVRDVPVSEFRVTVVVERKDGKSIDDREAILAASEALAVFPARKSF